MGEQKYEGKEEKETVFRKLWLSRTSEQEEVRITSFCWTQSLTNEPDNSTNISLLHTVRNHAGFYAQRLPLCYHNTSFIISIKILHIVFQHQ